VYAATLSLARHGTGGGGLAAGGSCSAMALVITNSAPASNTAVASGDYQTFPYLSTPVEMANNRITSTAWEGTSAGTYQDFTLNASGIAKFQRQV